MNDIDLETLEHLSHLVKIDIPKDQRSGVLSDLEKVLDYAHLLDAADTDGVPPCYHVLEDLHCPRREDLVKEDFTSDDLLSNAPQQTGGMIKIPPLMEPQ